MPEKIVLLPYLSGLVRKNSIVLVRYGCSNPWLLRTVCLLWWTMLSMECPAQIPLASRYSFDIADPSLKNVSFTPLTIKVNSVYSEAKPVISGKYLFFCRRNHPGNFNKEKDNQDIWLSMLDSNGQWGEPKNLGTTINTKNADVVCSVSDDGNEIYFHTDYIDLHKPLLRSSRTPSGWSKPVPVEIENFSTRNPYVDFFISTQNKVLISAIEMKDSKGDQDLYVSFLKEENKWSVPINMGSTINSIKADFAPFLSPDGKTLFFSSYRDGGLGGSDIYYSVRLDDSFTKWTEPQNLGIGINSSREETNFSILGNHIYFESYDLTKEVRDIFMAVLPRNLTNTVTAQTTTK